MITARACIACVRPNCIAAARSTTKSAISVHGVAFAHHASRYYVSNLALYVQFQDSRCVGAQCATHAVQARV